jgi:sulfite exporter TauE/SafE
MNPFVAGCLLGFAGSVHCVLMCGPLIAAGGPGGRTRGRRLASFASYHAGRGLSYQGIAVAAALLGRAFALAGLSAALSIACGLLLLASILPARLTLSGLTAVWMRPLRRASGGVARLSRSRPLQARFLGGMVNGLLPCGLTYAAALTATTTSSSGGALAFMGGFGAATLPALALVTLCADALRSWPVARLRWLPQISLTVAGLLLVARGVAALDLGPADRFGPPASHTHHAMHQGIASAAVPATVP